jgi:hypothetical protein
MKRIYSVGLAMLLTAACSSKSDDGAADDKKTDNENSDGNSPETAAVGALALSDLKLSDSITPPIPDQMKTSSASLSLTANSRSLEQCLLRDAVSQMEMNIANVTSQLCMFENMPGMKWGGKYNISFAGMGPALRLVDEIPPPPPGDIPPPPGEEEIPDPNSDPNAPPPVGTEDPGAGPGEFDMPESMQVFMDDTVEGTYNVWVCQDNELVQKFTIKGAAEGKGSKGNFQVKMSLGGDNEMLLAGNFDKGVTLEGRYLGDVQMRFSMSGMEANNYVKMNLGLAEDDVHIIRTGNEYADSLFGSGETTKQLLAGRIGPEYGMALVQRTGGEDSMFALEGEGPETSRAYFNAEGDIVTADSSADFEEGGTLYVTAEEMPRLLPEFAIDFGADAWDCSGTSDLEMG